MAHSYEDWVGMSDDELIKIYNEQAPSVFIGLSFIIDELGRRRAERQLAHLEKLNDQSAKQVSKLARLTEEGAEETKAMVAMTATIARLTKVIMALTVVTALVSIAALIVALR